MPLAKHTYSRRHRNCTSSRVCA